MRYLFPECTSTRDGQGYIGKINVTETGKQCQRWDRQYPHQHSYKENYKYPDATISNAENYCRNPEASYHLGTWCYTMDPSIKWEHCNIPACGMYKPENILIRKKLCL